MVKYDDPGPIAPFQKQHCMVYLNVGIAVNKTIPRVNILDTGASVNLVSSEMLPPKWLRIVKPI